MSKGTLTPRTVRESVENNFIASFKQELVASDAGSQVFYDKRNEKLNEKNSTAVKVTKIIQAFEKYSAGAFDSIKTKHAKFEKHFKSFDCPDSVLSLQDLPDKITFTNIYKYRAIGEGSHINSTNSPIVFHYGIKVENAHFLKGRAIDSNELNPVEKDLIEQAVVKLNNNVPAENIFQAKIKDNYQYNAVLVDIIARKNAKDGETLKSKSPPVDFFNAYTKPGSQIDQCTITYEPKAKSIEIHTVVLWKTGNAELSLIDPSDYNFSSFLNGKDVKGYKIKALNKDSKLYLAEASNGSGGTPRDCTDIAVKIAFELIEQQKSLGCNNVENTLSNMQKQISNNKSLPDIKMPDNFKHFKFFQSSDHALRKSAKEEVNKIKQELLKHVDASKLITPDDMYETFNLLGALEEANTIEDLF